MFHLLEGGISYIIYLEFFFMGYLPILPTCLVIESFIHVRMDCGYGYLFCTLGYDPVLFYFVVQM